MIVQHAKGTGAAKQARKAAGSAARPGQAIPRLGLTSLDPHGRTDAAATWKRLTGTGRSLVGGANKLWLDGRMHVALDKSVPQINAPQAWSDGYTGKGVTVAVLDSGYDSDHPDLAGRVSVSANFLGGDSAEDDNGHGTHVASTIAGVDSTYRGVAPDASLAVGKVCDNTGSCPTSALLAGIDWAVNTVHAKVVNMSLGEWPTRRTPRSRSSMTCRRAAARCSSSPRAMTASTAPARSAPPPLRTPPSPWARSTPTTNSPRSPAEARARATTRSSPTSRHPASASSPRRWAAATPPRAVRRWRRRTWRAPPHSSPRRTPTGTANRSRRRS